MCDFSGKDTNFPKWSCVLNCCSECTGVFVTYTEMNDEDDVNFSLIVFHH